MATLYSVQHALNSCNKTDFIPRQINNNVQGCAPRKITRSPKVANYEIQGAQHKAYINMKEITLSGRPKAKISRLRYPGALRAQP